MATRSAPRPALGQSARSYTQDVDGGEAREREWHRALLIGQHVERDRQRARDPQRIEDGFVVERAILSEQRATGLGDAFTPDVERAWTRVYSLIAVTMQAGANEAVTMRAAE